MFVFLETWKIVFNRCRSICHLSFVAGSVPTEVRQESRRLNHINIGLCFPEKIRDGYCSSSEKTMILQLVQGLTFIRWLQDDDLQEKEEAQRKR